MKSYLLGVSSPLRSCSIRVLLSDHKKKKKKSESIRESATKRRTAWILRTAATTGLKPGGLR